MDPGSPAGTTARTVCLWCPDWPVVALRRAGRAPASGPVVVLDRGRVRAASDEARAAGVRRGLRRREVEARCPAVVLLDADEALEARVFEAVARALEGVTPRVGVERPGLLSFPARGPSRYFGGDGAVAGKVLEAVAGVGGDGRVGVAGSGFAASLAARAAGDGRGAEPAGGDAGGGGGDRATGDGRSLVVPDGDTVSFLARWPVRVLAERGLGEVTELLARLGVRSLGDLAALPEPAVAARFGGDGVVAHRLARGLDPHPSRLAEPPPDLDEVVELDPPAQRIDTAAFAAKALADRLLARLEGRGLACTRVLVAAETEHGERLARLWSHEGALTAGALAQRVRWQLEAWLSGRGLVEGRDEEATGGLVLLRVTPDEVVAAGGRQLGFWGADPRAAERAGRVFARLQGMLGHEAVVTPVVGGGRTPTDRVTWVPWGDARSGAGGVPGPVPPSAPGPAAAPATTPGPAAAASGAPRAGAHRGRGGRSGERPAPWPGAVPSPAPARVHEPPLPADLLDGAGTPVQVSGRGELARPPARLRCAGGVGVTVDAPVEAWAGPWVHDVRWWDPGERRRRALFQVVAGGVVFLVSIEGGCAGVAAVYD